MSQGVVNNDLEERARELDESRVRLENAVARSLDLARQRGADQAQVSASSSSGLTVTTRQGEVETLEYSRDRGVGITVFVGGRKGSSSTADLSAESIEASVRTALSIATHTQPDPCAGLADADRMATDFPELDLWHPWVLEPEEAINFAKAMEAAAFGVDKRIDNSDGAMVDTGSVQSVYGNSHGFLRASRGTRHSVSCVVIASENGSMQRDYWYDQSRDPDELPSADAVGAKAGQRTVRRLGARKAKTRKAPILFAPEMARTLVGHLSSALSGAALYRKNSFLQDSVGETLFPSFVRIAEHPHEPKTLGASAYDNEGVATEDSDLITDGVVRRYLLGSYSARKLGLTSTANAGGTHNLTFHPGTASFEELMREMSTGLVVTEMMGQGVKLVTGDYSRGASGFWVENGEIAYPVEEITVAGNLRDMFAGVAAVGKDLDARSGTRCPSLLIDEMTVAGD